MTIPNTFPPTIGQDPWGEDLNGYLGNVEARVAAVEAANVSQDNAIGNMQGDITALKAQKPQVSAVLPYTFNVGVGAPPPASGEVRFDNADQSAAQHILITNTDLDNRDNSAWFALLANGLVRISDWGDATKWHTFRVLSAAADVANSSYDLQVTRQASGQPLTGDKVAVAISVEYGG